MIYQHSWEEEYKAWEKKPAPKRITPGEKFVTGEWGGQEIWRQRTAAEALLSEIEINKYGKR